MNDIYTLWWHLLIYYLWRCLLIDNLRRNLLINHLWLYPTVSYLVINCLRNDSLCFLLILILYNLFVIHNIFCYLLHYYYYTIVPFKYPHKKSVAHFRLHWCSEVLDYLTFTTTTTYVHAQRRELRCYSL